MKAYFISGLGADEQMFARTALPAPYEIVHLPWLEPHPAESFPVYARRLAEGINTSEPFILAGLSLGGMMAIEMNRFLQPFFTILISSATNRKALPYWFKLAAFTRIYKIIPDYFYHHRNFFSSWLLGAKSADDKQLLASVMANASSVFVRWAIPRILHWDNTFIPEKMKHLHGTADVILPYHPNPRTVPIKNGTHFMVYNRAEDVNFQLKLLLESI